MLAKKQKKLGHLEDSTSTATTSVTKHRASYVVNIACRRSMAGTQVTCGAGFWTESGKMKEKSLENAENCLPTTVKR